STIYGTATPHRRSAAAPACHWLARCWGTPHRRRRKDMPICTPIRCVPSPSASAPSSPPLANQLQRQLRSSGGADMSTTWTLLHEAFEHVLQHERSRELTEYRLRRVLGTRKSGPQVRCRAGVVLTPMQSQRERENVMLPGDFWLLEVDDDGQADDGAIVNWQEDSACLPESHPFAPWLAYRIEVCLEDLLSI